jgi:AcrR family transcriptional regulator
MSKAPRIRKQRATPEMILDAARRIAREEGWPAVTIRRVADVLGYTSPLIYEHFRDKGAALAAIVGEGFGTLAAGMSSAAAAARGDADPAAPVLAAAHAYVAFARAHPEVYQVMHGLGGVALDPAETARGTMLVCELAVDALRNWSERAGVPLADPLAETEILWSTLHGLCALELSSRLDGGAARTDLLVARAVTGLLAGWAASPT